MKVSVEVGAEVKGETKARRCAAISDHLISIPYPNEPSCNTAYAALKRSSVKFANQDYLGHRKYEADGTRGAYQWESYSSVFADVVKIGAGMRGLCGLDSKASVRGEKQARIGIYAINRPEWIKTLMAAFSQRIVAVPLYDTLGPDAVKFIVTHAELDVVACERSKLPSLLKGGGALKRVVLFEDLTDADKSAAKAAGVEISSLTDLREAGWEAREKLTEQLPDPEDWAYIMYTSGTTGDPKGVILSHKNLISSCAGLIRGVSSEKIEFLRNDDVYISFLPLAHSFETLTQVSSILVGAAVGFYQGDVRKLVTDDIPLLRPTVMAGVPRVYSRIYDKVTQGIAKKGGVAQKLFSWGFSEQSFWVKQGFRNPVWDLILFNKVRAALGGRVRLLASGAAPLSQELHQFLKVCFGCPVLQGYGMTENCAAAVVMPISYAGTGNVGGPIPCTEVKLQDTDDYKCTDVYPASAKEFEEQVSFKGEFRPSLAGKVVPRGEVCLRGMNVFVGYFKNDVDTKETLDKDMWLHTGDIGTWNADGSLSIVDRKKNIFKLGQGEYVSPEAVENACGPSKFVGQIWIYGNSFENYVVAVVVPDKEVLMAWAADAGKNAASFEQLVADAEVQKVIFDDLLACGKAAKLRGFELPKKCGFESTVNELGQGFTIEDELLTPTMKLKRPQLLKRYQKKIDAMYAEINKEEEAAKARAV
eukprot:CAMPEP_0173389900 /NCGR_PEP_ID=MMETSP1356-20130122/13899_1 /TAXON_ID=77927 ORGANISM="Hemiselmis virescens, Strain PCC157" /NCGR_SAMPLE_ID=MMETSP1356 /ASSEMBLY_ACC=CAM_ASM_000847 /LENGTH=701 /DNA_ID=CAMNT_0014347181 /DNA_START=23 /DNA_END=2128 /DNA_ORIENTATION=+